MNCFGPDGPGVENAANAVHILLNHYHDEVVTSLDRIENPEDMLVRIALLVRSPTLVEAVLCLAEAGFGREAMMLNRPLMELMLDAYWAQTEPEKADERFLAHARYTQHLQREVARRYPEMGITPPHATLDPEEVESSKKKFGAHAERSWTGLSLWERVRLFEAHLSDQGDAGRHRLWFFFDVLHDLNNGELHPSSWSLGRALRRIPGEGVDGDRFEVRIGPESEFSALALGCAWWIFVQVLDLMHGICDLPPDALEEAAEAGTHLLGIAEEDPAP